jgi:hypothetical protein
MGWNYSNFEILKWPSEMLKYILKSLRSTLKKKKFNNLES